MVTHMCHPAPGRQEDCWIKRPALVSEQGPVSKPQTESWNSTPWRDKPSFLLFMIIAVLPTCTFMWRCQISELQTDGHCHVGVGNCTWVLGKSSALSCWAISLALQHHFLKAVFCYADQTYLECCPPALLRKGFCLSQCQGVKSGGG